MLKLGQVVRVPRDTTEQRWVRGITVEGEVGGLYSIESGDAFIIVDTLAARDDVDEGDYLAVERGRFRLYLLRKEVAEGWDLEVDPTQEDERRTLDALQVIETELTTARTGPPRADGAPPAREVVLRYHHWSGLFEVEGVTDDTRFTRAKRDRLTSALRWYADQNDRPARSPEHRGLTERCERAERERDEARAEVQRLQAERDAMKAEVIEWATQVITDARVARYQVAGRTFWDWILAGMPGQSPDLRMMLLAVMYDHRDVGAWWREHSRANKAERERDAFQSSAEMAADRANRAQAGRDGAHAEVARLQSALCGEVTARQEAEAEVQRLTGERAALRAEYADLLANADACQHLLTRAVRAEAEVERLRAERAVLMEPAGDVDLEEVVDTWPLVRDHFAIPAGKVGYLVRTAPTLAREVARLRAALCGARRALDESGIASTGDLAADIQRLTNDVNATAEDLTSELRADLEETRLDLKVESGAESGAPHPDWRCSNGRLRLYHRYYGGDLHAVVNADGDWMLYRAGANMLEVKEEIASGPPQLKRSAMLAADVAATQVQEKP